MTESRPPQLVYLYGPPAVGKLKVAEKLAELTGYRLFHNHLTVNALRAVFDFGTEAFGVAIHRLRLDVFADAARFGIDLIFTNNSEWGGAAGRQKFVAFASEAAARVGENGGEVRFVQLIAPDDVLIDRVSAESRRAHSKLVEPRRLREMLAVHERAPLHDDDLVLDTSVLAPDAAAQAIATWLHSAPRASADADADSQRDQILRPNREELATVGWFNELAAVQVAAGCVLRTDDGRILLVDPVYKPQWELPGGALEAGETPSEGCAREVMEELHLQITPLRLLCVDHQSMRSPRRDAMRFVFDGGLLSPAQLDEMGTDPAELAGWKLVPLDELEDHLSPRVANRVRRGLAQPGVYLENGLPPQWQP